ncbi:MAG TPA: tripartite tricarboxylate transporter substrate binding protein [Xanthobacteraceae bacterium]
MHRRSFCLGTGAAAAGALLPLRARAQSWPARPIRMIVPFPAGGGTDAISRQVAERITSATGWSIVIENRAGAGGNIGLEALAKAQPDGHTIGMGQAANLAINPSLYPKMPYDPLKDFALISLVATQPLVAVVSIKSRHGSLAELVAAAKAKPSTVTIGHTGNGTVGHLAGEVFARQAGIKVLIVPYKGAAQVVTDILGGAVDLLFGNPLAVMPLASAGLLRPIAVTSLRRLPALPEVPTVEECGYQGFEATNWSGLVAPAKTPDAIVARLNAEVGAALRQPQMLEKLAIDSSEPLPSSPERFAEFLRAEHTKWGALIHEAGIKLE